MVSHSKSLRSAGRQIVEAHRDGLILAEASDVSETMDIDTQIGTEADPILAS